MPPVRRRNVWVANTRLTVAALALGAATTVGLSLVFSFRSSAYGRAEWSGVLRLDEQLAHAVRHVGFGKSILFWAPLRQWEQTELASAGTLDGAPRSLAQHESPPWSAIWDDRAFAQAVAARTKYGHHRHDIAVGWPRRAFKCLHGIDESLQPSAPTIWGGLELSQRLVERGTMNRWLEIRAIPLRPIWTGLAIDTAFYAAVFALLAHSHRIVRRALRRRGGLCPHCAYDLRGLPLDSPCPECGASIRP